MVLKRDFVQKFCSVLFFTFILSACGKGINGGPTVNVQFVNSDSNTATFADSLPSLACLKFRVKLDLI